MPRLPSLPPAEKQRIVLSVLSGEMSVAVAARQAKVSEQSVGNWERQFLEAGLAGLTAGSGKSSTREQQLEAEIAELTSALGEAAVELRVWKKSAEHRLGLRRPRGDPRRGGHVDREVHSADRHARADLAPLAGQGAPGRADPWSVADARH